MTGAEVPAPASQRVHDHLQEFRKQAQQLIRRSLMTAWSQLTAVAETGGSVSAAG
jgi:hypothetical protein